ncbi:ABC transporter substrate-binding protein [Acidianus sp. HS-5]|uniref:ABC transporter substrate-binding protein n=1 Tax=Acidianus sp. HS-5 TaxID=2886040 RepID=UPI001F44F3E4|nr:ABC transporter substrate-binding protein [Acidianus sp. HS-5]BDC17928.1 ABC transporter substrate-binding protein [Acidianus sp. HS-5]
MDRLYKYIVMNLKIVGLAIVILVIIGGIGVYELLKKSTEQTATPSTTTKDLRIVSITPSDTQDLIALGLGKHIVGVDHYSYCLLKMINKTSCVHSNVTVFPEISPVNISGLVALNPTVVVGEKGLLYNCVNSIQKAGIKIFLTNADYASNFYQIESCICSLAKYFNVTNSSKELINWMNSKLQEFSTTGDITVTYIDWICPNYYFWTAGGNVFINTLIQLGGGINTFGECVNYNELCPGKLIEANSDILVVNVVYNISYTKYLLSHIPGIQNVKAYKNGNVYFLCCGSSYLTNEPGPLAVYAVLLFHDIINGTAPHQITWSWIEKCINPQMPVF